MSRTIEVHQRTRSGIPPSLRWGFVGLLIFMTGVGTEANFITPHLVEMLGSTEATVSVVITTYSFAVLVGSYLSGVLADLWGPKRGILIGYIIFVVFHVAFVLAIQTGSLALVGLTYFLRGFGFPLFAFSFLVWVTLVTPQSQQGTAIGWFYVGLTGGLPTIGSLVAIASIAGFGGGTGGETGALWVMIGLATVGFCFVWFGSNHPSGVGRIAPESESTASILFSGIRLTVTNKKVLQGFLVRLINTAPQFGAFVIFPNVIANELGWGQARWLSMTVAVFAGNILFNAFFGAVGDRFGWVRTVRWCGVFASAVSFALWWYVPHWVPAGSDWGYFLSVGAGVLFGIFLAGFVPMGAIMPANVDPSHRGAAMAMYTTAAGGAVFLGTMVVAITLNITVALGWDSFARNSAVVWVFIALYACAFVMVGHLRTDQDDPEKRKAMRLAEESAARK